MKWKFTLCLLAILFIASITGSCSAPSCPTLNSKAPEFSLPSIDGETYALQNYRGKIVLVNFWQTTCTWCSYQMPFLQEINNKYKDNLTVLAINVGESINQVKDYAKEGNYTLNFLIDTEAKVNRQYCVPAFPATIFINKEGIIESAKLGAFQTEPEIEDYLKSL